MVLSGQEPTSLPEQRREGHLPEQDVCLLEQGEGGVLTEQEPGLPEQEKDMYLP